MPYNTPIKRFHFKRNDGSFYSKEGKNEEEIMMNFLLERTKEAGHQISFNEAKQDPSFIYPNEWPLNTKYRSFNDAAAECWRQIQPPPKEHLTERGKKLVQYLKEHPTPKPPEKTSESEPDTRKKPVQFSGWVPRFD